MVLALKYYYIIYWSEAGSERRVSKIFRQLSLKGGIRWWCYKQIPGADNKWNENSEEAALLAVAIVKQQYLVQKCLLHFANSISEFSKHFCACFSHLASLSLHNNLGVRYY